MLITTLFYVATLNSRSLSVIRPNQIGVSLTVVKLGTFIRAFLYQFVRCELNIEPVASLNWCVIQIAMSDTHGVLIGIHRCHLTSLDGDFLTAAPR